MTSNVVGLRGEVVVGTSEARPNVVAVLETLLEQARSGKVQGAQVIVMQDDGMAASYEAGVVGYSVVGMLLGQANRVAAFLDEDA